MIHRLYTLSTPLIDRSPWLRQQASRLLGRHFQRRGGDPAVVADAVNGARHRPIAETERMLRWSAALSHGASMPRGFRPDVALADDEARRRSLGAIKARLDRWPNIQLERQRLYLDDTVGLDEAARFARETLTDRLERKADGAYSKTIGVRHAFAVMSNVIDLLESAGHRPFLVSGTLLGVIRDGDLLEHDYDVDLGLLPGDGTPDDVAEAVRAHGSYQVQVEEHRVLVVHESGVAIDIFFHYERDGRLWHATQIHEWWNTPFELDSVSVRGRDLAVPADPERYLTENYGDWSSSVAFYHMSFDTPNRVYRQNKHGVLYLYSIFLTALEEGDRFVAESAARELRDAFDIDITGYFNDGPLISRA